jgi:nucleoside-diphosphate-sugar epimerase
MLVQAGHAVTGTTRTAAKTDSLRASGADAVVLDALDPVAVASAVERARPEVILHELTAIPLALDPRIIEEQFRLTNRLRTEGTDHLLAAARSNGVRRFVAQSFAGWPYARTGSAIKTEEDPLDSDPPRDLRETLMAIRYVESAVLQGIGIEGGIEGIVLRYGNFYGPGNAIGENGATLKQLRHRQFPIIGGGTGVSSFIHIDDAALATVAAVERGEPGIYNIVDDDPAPGSEWIPTLARIIGAKPPGRVPAWIARRAFGERGMLMISDTRGASNRKAKRELGWQPRWASWRDGFKEGLAETGAETPGPQPQIFAS